MAKKKEVAIRMYRQGLGDCFLLTFPGKKRKFHMLIDCGALASKHYGADLMREVVGDIKKTTEGRLDVIAGTHEHWDHISGFSQAEEIFKQMAVDQVWVAWTEDPQSEAARAVKEEFQKQKMAVELAVRRLPTGKGRQLRAYRHAIGELLGFLDGLGAGGGVNRTEAAWKAMLARGRNVYCDLSDRPLELEGVPGVRVYVLGPPTDPEFIRKRLSKKETYDEGHAGFSLYDSFLAAVEGEGADPDTRARTLPFDERFRVPEKEAAQTRFFQDHYGFTGADAAPEWRRIDHDWLTVAGELALHLDSYTNNTCLALAIELVSSGRVLLFPGDAQVGNWLSWGNRSWKVPGADGTTRTVTTDDLLARTVLYKVGHHGSHNATLRANGLEKMGSPELVAMIPVHRPTAQDQEWQFPYPPLWKRLKEKAHGRVLLADAKDMTELPEAKASLSPSALKAFEKRTTFAPLFVEHRVPY